MEIKFFEDIDRALGLSSFFVHEKVKSSTLNAHRQRRVSWCSAFALFDAEPVEVGEVFLAGVGEGEAEVDEAAGEVCEGDGDFLPLVPVAGGLELGGGDFFVVGSHRDSSSGAGGGVVEGDLLAAPEAEAMILGPLVVVDGSDEGFAVLGGLVEQFRASVFGKVFGLNGAGLQSDGSGAGEG